LVNWAIGHLGKIGRNQERKRKPRTLDCRGLEALPFVFTETRLPHDRTNHRHRDVPRMHRDSNTPPVRMHIAGMAAALPVPDEPCTLQLADDLASAKRSKPLSKINLTGEIRERHKEP